jgi:hypothetical protein
VDDWKAATPNTVNLTTTTIFTLTYSDGDMAFTDQVTVFVYEVNLKIYTPASLGGPTVLDDINSDDELTIGSQCFINHDNDDNDGEIDLEDDNVTSSANNYQGDNDLIMVTCALKWLIPVGIPVNYSELPNKIRIEPKDGGNKIKLWNSPKKGFDYNGVATLKAAPNGNAPWNTPNIYIEGVMLSSTLRDVTLRGDLIASDGVDCGDMVALSVIDVAELKWVGKGNGYTIDPGNNNNNNVLDNADDPGGINSRRVFPDARFPNVLIPKNHVGLIAVLNLPAIKPFTIYVKVFDVDDPATCNWEACEYRSILDPNDCNPSNNPNDWVYYGTDPDGVGPLQGIVYNPDEDNRGSVEHDWGNGVKTNYKAGFLENQNQIDAISDYSFAVGTTEVQKDFTVSMFAGDSYRAAYATKREQVVRFRNKDAEDELKIVDFNGAPTNIKKGSMSDVLTVWRIFNLEMDVMAPFTNKTQNSTTSNFIVDFVGASGSVITSLEFKQILQFINGENDFSPFQNALPPFPPGGTGAYAEGKVFVPNTNPIGLSILNNGEKTLNFQNPVSIVGAPLKFILGQNGLPNLEGFMSNVTKNGSEFQWTPVFPNVVNLNPYFGGKLKVGGGSVLKINGVINNIFLETANLSILAEIEDDDGLPEIAISSDEFLDPLKSAYLLPILFAHNSEEALPFANHIYDDKWLTVVAPKCNLQALENEFFWGGYVSGGWEESSLGDHDSNSETDLLLALPANNLFHHSTYFGLTVPIPMNLPGGDMTSNSKIGIGGTYSVVYNETIEDWYNLPVVNDIFPQIGRVTIHELGHQFGLNHPDVGLPTAGCENSVVLNQPSIMDTTPVFVASFTKRQLHFMRSRKQSPGH